MSGPVVFDPAQHYDHCWVKFEGQDWLVTRISDGYFYLANELYYCVGDFSKVNWTAYVAKAVQLIEENWRF